MKDSLRFKDIVARMESREVLIVYDEKGRRYMWDGIGLYRLQPLKGAAPRRKRKKEPLNH